MGRLTDELRSFCATNEFNEKTRFLLSTLLENMRSADSQYRSRIFAMVTALLAFELLRYSAIEKISLIGVELNKLDSAFQFMPALTAYFYSSAMALFSAHFIYQESFDDIVGQHYPTLYRENLHLQLRPVFDFRVVGILKHHVSGIVGKVLMASLIIFVIIVFVLPPIYAIYAYSILFATFGATSIATWLSATLAIVFSLYGILIAVGEAMRTSGPAQQKMDEPSQVESA